MKCWKVCTLSSRTTYGGRGCCLLSLMPMHALQRKIFYYACTQKLMNASIYASINRSVKSADLCSVQCTWKFFSAFLLLLFLCVCGGGGGSGKTFIINPINWNINVQECTHYIIWHILQYIQLISSIINVWWVLQQLGKDMAYLVS